MTSIVVIDCDTGLDDAVALALAKRSGLRILAVTTVGGNVPVNRTTRNTLDWMYYLGGKVPPVYRGLNGPLHYSGDIHGKNGLGDVTLPKSPYPVGELSAPEQLVGLAQKNPGQVILVATGPLTNLAEAIRLDPEAIKGFARIVIMGGAVPLPGAAAIGNVEKNVEFNFGCDPQSARVVFQWAAAVSKQLEMIGLNVTEQLRMTPAEVDQMQQISGELGKQLTQMVQPIMDFYEKTYGRRVFVPHDAIAVMRAQCPESVTMVEGHIEVLPTGQSVLVEGKSPNALVAQTIQRDLLMRQMFDRLFGEEV